MSSKEIIKLARKASRGNRTAFEILCRKKQKDIVFYAYSILGDMDDAEDVTQEAILTMFRSIGQLKHPEAIESWIMRIVRSRCLDLVKSGKYSLPLDANENAVDAAEDYAEFLPEAYAENESLSEELYGIVCALPQKQREAVLMYYYENLSYKEIAEATGVSDKTVSTNLTRARNMIKARLEARAERDKRIERMYGVSASTTVLGRVLKAEAGRRIPEARMIALQSRWEASIEGLKMPVTRMFPSKPAVLGGIGAAAVVVIAVTMLPGHFDGAQELGVSEASETVSEPSGRTIGFTGGGCECGHVNPQGIILPDGEAGDTAPTWKIAPVIGAAADSAGTDDSVTSGGAAGSVTLTGGAVGGTLTGSVLFSGGTEETAAEIRRMEADGEDGNYLLTGTLRDKDGNTYRLERRFVIGNYSGDA
jgi:RNA polymerase sigma-70 factor (ECF subfamily)